MIPILITVMICLTLITVSKIGIDIRISKSHSYKDETSFQVMPEAEDKINLDEKESRQVKDLATHVQESINSYFASEDDEKEEAS